MSSFLDKMSALSEDFQKSMEAEDRENDQWWNSLSIEDRERAFYSVVKRIVEGDIEKQGSYRFVLYDVFGFDPGSYVMGMNCGYMTLHNSIYSDEEIQKYTDEIARLRKALQSARDQSSGWKDEVKAALRRQQP